MTVRFGGPMACMLALTLAACGGGNGSNGGTPNPGTPNPGTPNPGTPNPGAPNPGTGSHDGSWLTFSPAAPSVTQYEGESVPVVVTATSTLTNTKPFNVAIIDPASLTTTDVSAFPVTQASYVGTLHTMKGLSAGTHTTSVEVRLCEDEPLTCAKPLPGSPWHVPLTVRVKSKAEAATRLTLSAPSISVSTYPGEAASFSIEAQLNTELASHVAQIGIVDPASITVVPGSQMTTAASGHYVFNLSTAVNNALPIGPHTSNLELRLCEDDVQTCQRPLPGSPWIVPLTVTVKSPNNLSPLHAIAGLGSWSTYQGNAAHTGFVDASFDPAGFSRRWRLAGTGNYSGTFASTAIDGGRAFFVRGNNNHWEAVAVSEDTGALAWTVDLGSLYRANPPAVANGRVYLTSSGHEDSYLWILDQATGELQQKVPMSSQWPTYSAPTVFGTDVYSINGYYGGIAKFSDKDSTFSWNAAVTVEEGWSPATDGQFVYTYSMPDAIFVAFNAADGTRAYSVGPPYPYSTYFTARPVVLTDTQQAIVADGNLMAFDLASHTRSWVLGTPSSGMVAYGNGTIYAFAANGTTLEAHAPATGKLLWTANLVGYGGFSNVIVTRNLAFVSSTSTTQAIDLTTHKVVWTYPQGGNLAISPRGVLYILDDGGTLAAVNLR